MISLTLKSVSVLSIALILNGCASIVSKTSYNVRLDTSPHDATVTVINRSGKLIDSGKTPLMVKLKPGAGYFKKAMYSITFSKPGYVNKTVVINADINGWYFGNIVFGGLVGLLIVDPATGAMYKLDKLDVNETLAPENTTGSVRSLEIYDINKIPKEWKKDLVKIE